MKKTTAVIKAEDHKFGFIIIFREFNHKLINDTIKSVKIYYQDHPLIIVCPSNFDTDQIKWIKSLNAGSIAQGGKTTLEMVNFGISNSSTGWNLILLAGSKMKTKIDGKYSRFLDNYRQILHVCRRDKMNFYEASLSGTMIHKDTLKEVGDFEDVSPNISDCLVYWMGKASLKDAYKFIGLVGVPLTN